MAYRPSKRHLEQLVRMREVKALKRELGAAPDYPRELPELRRRIVITDYDFGERVHTLDPEKLDAIRLKVFQAA